MPPAAIVAAGGRGERALGDDPASPKQFRPLHGRPMIEWSIRVLVSCGCSPIVVAAPEDMLELARTAVGATEERVVVVAGGADRQSSVRNALEVVTAPKVLVHDAARPLVTTLVTRRVLGALERADAVVPAVPVAETIKEVTMPAATVARTVDRSNLWLAQTPQGFATAVLRDAHERAVGEGLTATDDAQLVERYGGACLIVEGDPRNVKVTHPSDFVVAEALLEGAP